MSDREDMDSNYRGWEYSRIGEYHRNLDPNWSYTPTYLRKVSLVKQVVTSKASGKRVLDVGCGEGVFVDLLNANGFLAEGIDLNYESEKVKLGSVLNLPYENESFDTILLLDVFEHLQYSDQPEALKEIWRVLQPNGLLIATIPNLLHLNSRFTSLFFGRLDRTDIETNHLGERPYYENKQILQHAGFKIKLVKGITLTVPILYRFVICKRPKYFRWLHDLLEPLALPSIALLDLFVCQKQYG